jgi:hypothetical protein
MAEKQTWYVVVEGVLDNRVGYVGADEQEALGVWRSSSQYKAAGAARRAVRAVPRDGRFSVVSAKTRGASALSDRGLSLTDAIARYQQRQADTAIDAYAPAVLLGDDRSRARPVGRTRDVWELTFTPPHVAAKRTGGPSISYYLLYQEKPGGLPHERTDIYSEPEAEAAVREALRDAEVGSYAVVWRAPYQEHAPWQSWDWERSQAYLKIGPRNVVRVNPVMALSAIPRRRYLDRGAEGEPLISARRYPVNTHIDVDPIGGRYRARGMHVGQTYEVWGTSERAAVKGLKAAIEAEDPAVRITRARTRR